MDNNIHGIHHITAIAGNARRNYRFYTHVLGFRLDKLTVNFDDPDNYHLYYGNAAGTPGTILTFFPYESMVTGRRGPRQATEIGLSVPADSLDFWLQRLQQYNVIYNKVAEKFGERYLTLLDPDGLKLELTVAQTPDDRQPWETEEVKAANAIRGFHQVTITTSTMQPTADILTTVLDYRLADQQVNRYRFINPNVQTAALVDLVEAPGERAGHVAGGSVHHVAFRVKDEATLMAHRDKIAAMGLHVTEVKDRNYFRSAYFREPGGLLFELATDGPGFTVDEPAGQLGSRLMLPPQFEARRSQLEATLPPLT